jgi:hypothetical protein
VPTAHATPGPTPPCVRVSGHSSAPATGQVAQTVARAVVAHAVRLPRAQRRVQRVLIIRVGSGRRGRCRQHGHDTRLHVLHDMRETVQRGVHMERATHHEEDAAVVCVGNVQALAIGAVTW